MFVAINYITCQEEYKPRFESLFLSRAHAIDRMDGFIKMEVLKPADQSADYLIVSHWENEASFKDWTGSPEFREGHQRGFKDLEKAKASGTEPPMKSTFKTYQVLTV
ncbi:MAG TPA: antibiotic biosynthesis monooxygenase [Saprospiraceae bacterium]|nr:antibiotic biosynthesis monooxygenase [Saprospiraceae bacterium]MCB9270768.1 antibiotic biosynthesis monooxygenase [Lewinellaceae bacterium]HPG05862.1 antibiotic biosynthesis monooxygenase [Saprospiraceae bacterium]HPQ99484.1 antibiotic biosynthesis monooxygenase [Saprospiraceae bacterium]HQU51418.1 antibiotic biosynthesis monooxygenase [Saprospiraceae bacterium]